MLKFEANSTQFHPIGHLRRMQSQPKLVYCSMAFAFRKGLLTCILLVCTVWAKMPDIHLAFEPGALDGKPARLAFEDFRQLLDQSCNCVVAAKTQDAIQILVGAPTDASSASPIKTARSYPYLYYPPHGYTWSAKQGLLHLEAESPMGIANGLYALLQEKLGFQFYHPRESFLPQLESWPLPDNWTMEGRPVFDKKGFHLHTMHPLELAQALHDPAFPDGLNWIEEYVLWLARNGQNYFDFSLMEGVDEDLEAWVAYAAQFTQFAQDRGILCGLDVSLHMVQQKSYKLVEFKPKDFRSAEKQIRQRIQTLMKANWDIINLEFNLAEFVGGMEKLRDRMREAVLDELKQYPNTKVVGRQHVVKPENELGGKHGQASLNVPQSNEMGLLVHTVMCYALEDSTAPVYELKNFQHVKALLAQENQVRETWYYPESAYWVTFDNSIPLLLLPYLSARLRDIQVTQKMGIPGHLTFSSGWEWGYWMIDWSIARWSWDIFENGKKRPKSPLQFLPELIGEPAVEEMAKVLKAQEAYFIGKDMMRFLCPTNPTDELPKKFSKQFQPRMPLKWAEMRKRKNAALVDSLFEEASVLFELFQLHNQAAESIRKGSKNPLAAEIANAIQVTGLRCLHQYVLLGIAAEGSKEIDEAAQVRLLALGLAKDQRNHYRYPLKLLIGSYPSFTSYDFGYLHTADQLHFWKREEMQYLKRRKGPFFMNKYDLLKIGGFKD